LREFSTTTALFAIILRKSTQYRAKYTSNIKNYDQSNSEIYKKSLVAWIFWLESLSHLRLLAKKAQGILHPGLEKFKITVPTHKW